MKMIRVWMAVSGLGLFPATQVSMASDLKLKTKPVGPVITVFVKKDNLLVADLRRAEQVASRVFASIGIPVVFRFGAAPKSAAEGALDIELQLDAKAPSQLHVGALAYAMPFGVSGTRIRVFCDRVSKVSPENGPGTVLGYVMAHEIAHVLEGVSRHSEEGIMKGHWQQQDYRQMKSGTLRFDPTDVELILAALHKRAAESARAEPRPHEPTHARK
jgi:hypothetical protein